MLSSFDVQAIGEASGPWSNHVEERGGPPPPILVADGFVETI